MQVADRVVTRRGRRCITLYAWEIPERLDQEHVAHLVFIFENGGRIEPREYRIGFHPFTLGELRERLEVAGLREVDTDFDDDRDRYSVTAPRSDVAGIRARRGHQSPSRAAETPNV